MLSSLTELWVSPSLVLFCASSRLCRGMRFPCAGTQCASLPKINQKPLTSTRERLTMRFGISTNFLVWGWCWDLFPCFTLHFNASQLIDESLHSLTLFLLTQAPFVDQLSSIARTTLVDLFQVSVKLLLSTTSLGMYPVCTVPPWYIELPCKYFVQSVTFVERSIFSSFHAVNLLCASCLWSIVLTSRIL